MFFAPALLWLGATLLLVRLRGRALAWLARTRRRAAGRRRHAGSCSPAPADAGRRSTAGSSWSACCSRSASASASSPRPTTSRRASTRSSRSAPTSSSPRRPAPSRGNGLARTIARRPGRRAISAVDHSYAYVGPDLRTRTASTPATIGAATKLRDSYFLGGEATADAARLRSTPDGILVSQGDDHRLLAQRRRSPPSARARPRSGRFRVVPFHVVGIVQEFPSAPKDSFMVANLALPASRRPTTAAPTSSSPHHGDPAAVAHASPRRPRSRRRPCGGHPRSRPRRP